MIRLKYTITRTYKNGEEEIVNVDNSPVIERDEFDRVIYRMYSNQKQWFSYDENGNTIHEKIQNYSDGKLFSTHEYVYKFDKNNNCIYSKSDSNGHIVVDTFEYNADDNLVLHIHNGKPYLQKVYEGERLVKEIKQIDTEDGGGVSITEWVTTEHLFDRYTSEDGSVILVYEYKDSLMVSSEEYQNGTSVKSKFVYDDSGRQIFSKVETTTDESSKTETFSGHLLLKVETPEYTEVYTYGD